MPAELKKVSRVRNVHDLKVPKDATDRVRLRVRQLFEERRFKQTKVAARLKLNQSAVNRYIHGATPLTISFLEAVEQESGVPLAELVAPPGTTWQLSADEALVVRALRRWPLTTTRALAAFVAFFADEPPQLAQTRNLHELYRRMPAKQRDMLYSVAVLLREGALPPDLRGRLLHQLESDQQAYAADPESRGRSDDENA